MKIRLNGILAALIIFFGIWAVAGFTYELGLRRGHAKAVSVAPGIYDMPAGTQIETSCKPTISLERNGIWRVTFETNTPAK